MLASASIAHAEVSGTLTPVDEIYGDRYMNWSVGVTYRLGNFMLGLKWVDGSDLEALDGTLGDVFSRAARAIFLVSTTFPWGE